MAKETGRDITLQLTVAEVQVILAALNMLLHRRSPFRSDVVVTAERVLDRIWARLRTAAE
jgi:hypothetical protein